MSPGYIRFIENYLINKAINHCKEEHPKQKSCYSLYSHENIMNRIRFIDSLTELPLLKNHFFSKLGALGIIMAKEESAISEVLELS